MNIVQINYKILFSELFEIALFSANGLQSKFDKSNEIWKKYFAALSDFALQFVNRFINTDK